MSQKYPVNGFTWIKKTFTFNEDFIKNYDENSNKGYVLQVDFEYPKKLLDLHSDLPYLSERREINKYNKLVCNLYDKKTMFFT